jgi:hypothetical protein
MDAVTAQQHPGLLEQLAEARARLDGLAQQLLAVDDELASFATARKQHSLLREICSALETLGETGGAELFWGDRASTTLGTEQIRDARSRIEAFDRRIGAIEERRRGLLAELGQEQDRAWLIEDDVAEAKAEEERRKYEWVVDREVAALHSRTLVMPWDRRSEDDRRFRKTLAIAVLFSLALGWIVSHVELPVMLKGEAVKVPERVVRMMIEKRALPPPAPRAETLPKPQEKVAEQKPVEPQVRKQREPEPIQPQQQAAGEVPQATPAAPKGILAFREKLAKFKDADVNNLGAQARLDKGDDSGPVTRSMLTTNGPGSSGGINLSSLSRGLGGGRGNGAGGAGMAGVQVTRATSAIGGGAEAGADRPRANGGRASRTDEEIQIVFDRYKAALYRLYNRELRKDPTLRGQMVLRLTIEPDGRVSMCVLQSSDMNAPELGTQVVERVRGIDFGAKDVDPITIVYPIDFLPAS